MIMKEGDVIKLITFNKTKEPDQDCDDKENYWKLIGWEGKIVKSPDGYFKKNSFNDERVLVRFDEDIKERNLHCHNEVENSLWILESDLELI